MDRSFASTSERALGTGGTILNNPFLKPVTVDSLKNIDEIHIRHDDPIEEFCIQLSALSEEIQQKNATSRADKEFETTREG